jgi:hypothetical protein
MTKTELKQIFYLNKEIEMWQKELDKIQCKSLIKCQIITDMPRGGGTGDKTADIAIEVACIEKIISGKLLDIQFQRRKIINYINSIDDSFIRQIVFFRNVSCMGWNQVAREMGEGYTENSIRMMYNRIFKSNN